MVPISKFYSLRVLIALQESNYNGTECYSFRAVWKFPAVKCKIFVQSNQSSSVFPFCKLYKTNSLVDYFLQGDS